MEEPTQSPKLIKRT